MNNQILIKLCKFKSKTASIAPNWVTGQLYRNNSGMEIQFNSLRRINPDKDEREPNWKPLSEK